MTKEELTKSVESNLSYVKDFYKRQQFFATMLVIEALKNKKRQGKVVILGNEGAMENRAEVMFDLGLRSAIEQFKGDVDSVEAICMMSEAWFSVPKEGEKLSEFTRPSEDPNRKEAIISTGTARDLKGVMRIFELKRLIDLKDDTMKVEFSPFESALKAEVEGNLEVDSPLLNRFWAGVKLMEWLFERMPSNLVVEAKKLSVDKFLNMIIERICVIKKEMREKKHD